MSFPACVRLIRSQFAVHYKNELERLARSVAGARVRCSICNLPTDMTCGCEGAENIV